MIADPRAAPADPRLAAIAGLARLVTEAPWTLDGADRERAAAAGLDDATVLHVVILSSFFGYLNRVADAVGIELDYDVKVRPPPPDPDTPPWPAPEPAAWPEPRVAPGLAVGDRPGAAAALAGWRAHVLDRDQPLARGRRRLIAAASARAVGDAAVATDGPAPSDELDRALIELTGTIARTPWRLGEAALAPVRAAGLADDAAVFDAISVAAFANCASRIAVALSALAR